MMGPDEVSRRRGPLRIWPPRAAAHAMLIARVMSTRSALFLLLGTILSCNGSGKVGESSGTGGAGGVGGAGGIGGGTGGGATAGTNSVAGGGGGGTGGTGGPAPTGGAGPGGSLYPACGTAGGQSAVVSGSIVDSGGVTVTMTTTAAVTIQAVESLSTGALRVGLADTATSRQWTWTLAMNGLGADRFKVGDAYDLTIDARDCPIPLSHATCQTIVLGHGSVMSVFTAETWGVRLPPVPALEPWGITVTDTGAICAESDQYCEHRYHGTQVTLASKTGTLAPGQILSLADASFVLGTFDQTVDHGICDFPGHLMMGGFRAP